MDLIEASQMNRLRKQGGLRELSPLNILSGGLEYPLAPQKNPISLKTKKGPEIMPILCLYLSNTKFS